MTIYLMSIVSIIGTWRLEALQQCDHENCQCHRSKIIKGNKKRFLFVDECVW